MALYNANLVVRKEIIPGGEITLFNAPEDAARFRAFWDEVVYGKMGVSTPNPGAINFVGHLNADGTFGIGVSQP